MGKTRLLRELAGSRRCRSATSCSPAAPRSSRRICRSGSSSTPSTSTSRLSSRAGSDALETETLADLARGLPVASDARRRRAAGRRPLPRRTARSGSCSRRSRPRSRSCSCSTTCTGRTPRRSSCSASLLRRPPDAAGPARRRPARRASWTTGSAVRSSAPAALAALTRLELGALSADEARELLGPDVTGAAAETLYEESSGNPFYLQQLARSPQSTDLAADAEGVSMAGVEVPGRGGRRAEGRARAPRARTIGACSRAPP